MRFFDTKQNVSFPVIVGWERGVLISWDVISRVVSEAPARVSLFHSLSSSKDFSDVDSYTARLCGFIILALNRLGTRPLWKSCTRHGLVSSLSVWSGGYYSGFYLERQKISDHSLS